MGTEAVAGRRDFEELEAWFGRMSSHAYLAAFQDNLTDLMANGLAEKAWLTVYTTGRPHTVAREVCRYLDWLDRAQLRAAGDPIPDGQLTLYRGVAGRGGARHVRGLSWT